MPTPMTLLTPIFRGSTRRTAVLGFAGLLVSALLVGCGTGGSSTDTATSDGGASADTVDAQTAAASRRAVPVEIQTVRPRTFRDVVQVTGSVEALRDAIISAEVGGRVESIARLGERLDAGDPVAGVNDRLLQASLEAARAQYRLAEETFQRQEALYRDSIISAAEYDNAIAQRDQASAQLDQAKERLANARPESPFGGRVEARYVETGEYVGPGQRLVRVVDTREVKVVAGVPERYITDIREGAEVDMRFRADRDSLIQGTVSFAGRTVDPNSRTYPVEIELANPDEFLAPEMIADLFITRTVLENVLVVPQSAIVRDEDDRPNIFLVDRSESPPIAEQRVVTLGPSSNGLTVVETGISAGNEILVGGQSQVTDGDPIRITDRRELAAGPSERGGVLN